MARRAYAYLAQVFWDETYGGVPWLIDKHGTVVNERKHSYAQAFAIYGMKNIMLRRRMPRACGWLRNCSACSKHTPTTMCMVGMLRVTPVRWTHIEAKFVDHEHGEWFKRPDPVPPIMIGSDGEQRTLRAVARHADWWNCYSQPPDVARRKLDVLNQHCEAEGRDFASIRKTWSGPVIIDRDHQAALNRAGDRFQDAKPPIVGDPAAVAERIVELAELGFELFQVGFDQFPDTEDMSCSCPRSCRDLVHKLEQQGMMLRELCSCGTSSIIMFGTMMLREQPCL